MITSNQIINYVKKNAFYWRTSLCWPKKSHPHRSDVRCMKKNCTIFFSEYQLMWGNGVCLVFVCVHTVYSSGLCCYVTHFTVFIPVFFKPDQILKLAVVRILHISDWTLTLESSFCKLNEDELLGRWGSLTVRRVRQSERCSNTRNKWTLSLTSPPPSPHLLVPHVELSWRQRALMLSRLLCALLWLLIGPRAPQHPLSSFILCFHVSQLRPAAGRPHGHKEHFK